MPHNHSSNDSVFALSKHTHTHEHIHTENAETMMDVKKLQAKGTGSPSSHLNTQNT